MFRSSNPTAQCTGYQHVEFMDLDPTGKRAWIAEIER